MVDYTTSCGEFEGLVPKEGMFPPYPGGDKNEAPTLKQWKRMKEGIEYFKNKRDTNSTNENGNDGVSRLLFDMNMGRLVQQDSCSNVASSDHSNNLDTIVGQIQIHTGLQIKNFRYSSNANENSEFEVGLGCSLLNLVKKVKTWKKLNKNTHECIFHVKEANGTSNYTTYDKNDMALFTVGALVEMMHLPKGKVLKLVADEKLIADIEQYDESPF